MNPPALRRYAAHLEWAADMAADPLKARELRALATSARIRASQREHGLPDLAKGIKCGDASHLAASGLVGSERLA